MSVKIEANVIKQYVERVERLEAEKLFLSEDLKQIFAEAKSNGIDVKALRSLIKLRKLEDDERREQEEILALYKEAIGMEA